MGGAFSTYGWRLEVYTGFWWGTLREREHVENPGLWDDIKTDLSGSGMWGHVLDLFGSG